MTITVLAMGLLGYNCETSNSINNIESALNDIIAGDDALHIDGVNDDDVTGDDYQSDDGLGRIVDREYFTDPVWWGRRNVSSTTTVEYDEFTSEDDTIIAHISKEISGTFKVYNIEDWGVHNIIDSSFKDFTMSGARNIRFVRIDNSDNPIHNWRIDAVTPVFASSPESTVQIQSITIYQSSDDSNGSDEVYFQITNDQLDNYFGRDDLPHFLPGQFVKIEVELLNTNTGELDERTYMHYGRRHGFRYRRYMFDDGGEIAWGPHEYHSPDEIADDNTYTGMWRMHGAADGMHPYVYRAFFDVIDEESLLDPDGEYHSVIIGFPYFVSDSIQNPADVYKP